MRDYKSIQGIISLGPWGGPDGDYWSFNASLAIIEIVITLVENNIHSISFKDAGGYISGTFGGRDPNAIKGDETKIGIQWPSEYLKSISGTYGDYNEAVVIKSLSFITNLITYGPYGTTSVDDHSFSIPISDSVVVGFHGRAGNYVDALGIHVQPDVNLYGTISFGPWGGSDGDAFSFRVQGSRIKQIIVQEDTNNIKSIGFKDANGHYYGKFGGKDPNDIGVQRTVEIDGYAEHLKSISGTYGDYNGLQVITSLSFVTNLNTYGPFGNSSGTYFSIPLIQGSLVIGFHGRSGYYLNAIGIHVESRDKEGIIAIGPWGGRGGNPWSYSRERINMIIMYVGANIKSISFRNASGLSSATFGGNAGERQIVHINWPSEHLISISGTHGDFAGFSTITSLSFTTNVTTHGPFGIASGTSFSIPISNSTVIGFHGRAGYYLDAIGIFVKPETTI